MIKSFHHTAISVSDMDEALAFYRDTLGMELTRQLVLTGEGIEKVVGLEGVEVDVVHLKFNDSILELFQYKSPPNGGNPHRQQNQRGLIHIAFVVDDVDEYYRNLSEKGFKFNSPPLVARAGGPKICYFYGPDDVVIELMQMP